MNKKWWLLIVPVLLVAVLGLVFYFAYGVKKSKLAQAGR